MIYIGAIVILTMNFWDASHYHLVQGQYLNVMYILAVAAFILYGFGLYRIWKNTPIARKSQANIRRMRLTLTITIIVAISFTIRVIVNAIRECCIATWEYRSPFEAVFYTVVEVVPIALLLWLMLASGFRIYPTKDVTSSRPLIAQADSYMTDEEYQTDFEEGDEEPTEDTPGGIFD